MNLITRSKGGLIWRTQATLSAISKGWDTAFDFVRSDGKSHLEPTCIEGTMHNTGSGRLALCTATHIVSLVFVIYRFSVTHCFMLSSKLSKLI